MDQTFILNVSDKNSRRIMSRELVDVDFYPCPLRTAPGTFRDEFKSLVKQYLHVQGLLKRCKMKIAWHGRMTYRASVCLYTLQVKLSMLKLTMVHLRFQHKLEMDLWCDSFDGLLN